MTRAVPPIVWPLLITGAFWSTVAFIVAGPLALGICLMVTGAAELLVVALSSKARLYVEREERIATYRRNGRLTIHQPTYREVVAWRAAQRKRVAA